MSSQRSLSRQKNHKRMTTTPAALNNAAPKTKDLATGQVESLAPEPEIATTESKPFATAPVGLASAAVPSQAALPQSQPGRDALVGTATSASPVLTLAQAVQRRRQQQREAAKEAEQQSWLASGDPILVKEAEAWFTGRARRLQSPLTVTVEQTDPGG